MRMTEPIIRLSDVLTLERTEPHGWWLCRDGAGFQPKALITEPELAVLVVEGLKMFALRSALGGEVPEVFRVFIEASGKFIQEEEES